MAEELRVYLSSFFLVAFFCLLSLGFTSGRAFAQKPGQNKSAPTTVETLPDGGAKSTTKGTDGDTIEIVTVRPDSKYGVGGSKVRVECMSPESDAEYYRDAAGKVREVHYTFYGLKDELGKRYEWTVKYDDKGEVKSYEVRKDNSNSGEKSVDKIKTDDERKKLEELSKNAADAKKFIDQRVEVRFPEGIPTEVEPPKLITPTTPKKSDDPKASDKGSDKNDKEPKPPKNPPPGGPPIPSSMPTIIPSKIANYLTNIKEPPGLHTIQFTAPNKDTLEVYLPRYLYPGQNLVSMHVIPSKARDGGSSFKNDKLQVGDTTVSIADQKFWSNFKLGDSSIKFSLLDSGGQSLGRVDFPITDFKNVPPVREIPTSATFGELIELDFPPPAKLLAPLILGKSPDFFEAKIGDQEMPIIAANAFGSVIREDYGHPGLTFLEVKIGDEVFKIPFRVLTLKLSADSLSLEKHQSTFVHIIAGGLENLKAPAQMTIVATGQPAGTITMAGATEVEIDPKMVASDGTYATDRSLYAAEAGGFSVNVTVKVDKEPFEKEPKTTFDKKVSVEDAEKRIKAHVDYIDKRRTQMAEIYHGDGAKKTLEDAFKKGGVDYYEATAKGLAQFWEDEGNRIYEHSSDLFKQYFELIRQYKSATESYLHYVDQALETWKKFDQLLAKQFQTLVDLYTTEALLSGKLHAIDVKYTDQKKEPRPRKEIDELNRQQEAESKPINDELKATKKEIDKVKRGTKELGAWLDSIQGK